MYPGTDPIERALTLAATGHFRTASEVRAALKKEGYPQSTIYPLFEGASFLKVVRSLLKTARRPTVRSSPPAAAAAAPPSD